MSALAALSILPWLLAWAPAAGALPSAGCVGPSVFPGRPVPSALWLSPALPAIGLYALGLAGLWRNGHVGRGVPVSGALAFAAGIIALLLAAVWPLAAWGRLSLAAHMAQHMLLLAVAPPLLLAGRPFAVVAGALPARWSQRLHAWGRPWQAAAMRTLALATAANVAVIGGWHVPVVLASAMRSEVMHALMHASFLLCGLWLWSLLWRRLRDQAPGALSGAVSIVAVMMMMGFLGALLTFSRRSLYQDYAERSAMLGLDPLLDQQLAGLIMWVPACLPYLIGALWLLGRGLRGRPH